MRSETISRGSGTSWTSVQHSVQPECAHTRVCIRARVAPIMLNYLSILRYILMGVRGRGFVYVLRIFELIYARAGYLNICVYICAQVSLIYVCVYMHNACTDVCTRA